jgi:hypothetical protein
MVRIAAKNFNKATADNAAGTLFAARVNATKRK